MELVGTCSKCGTSIFCRDGFLDGVVDNGTLYCHDCNQPQPDTNNQKRQTEQTNRNK